MTVRNVEDAARNTLIEASFIFREIEKPVSDSRSQKALRHIAVKGEQAVVSRKELESSFGNSLDNALELPTRREIIKEVDGGYTFHVELMRRWIIRKLK